MLRSEGRTPKRQRAKLDGGGGILNRVDGEREEYKVEVGERSGA